MPNKPKTFCSIFTDLKYNFLPYKIYKFKSLTPFFVLCAGAEQPTTRNNAQALGRENKQ